MFVVYFFIWLLVLYWAHRLAHVVPYIKEIHSDHHKFVLRSKYGTEWRLNNLILYNDTIRNTLNLWITEVIPTLTFSYVTGQWWIFIFYYIWAAFFQQTLKYDKDEDIFLLTPGMWSMIHYRRTNLNFGLFISFWDIVFKTNRSINYIPPVK